MIQALSVNSSSRLHGLTGDLLWRAFAASGAMPAPPEVGDDASALRLKEVVLTVTDCSRTTLLNPRTDVLVPKLDAYVDELHGFAYEGAGVGLAALDSMFPWKKRTLALATGVGNRHIFGIYLGAGMCLARVRRNPERFRLRLNDPVFSWIVLDGYGFYQGFFESQRHIVGQRVPARIRGYSRRVYDQGVGRAIWFLLNADVERVAGTIGAFSAERRADLWSGVGFACGYSGGIDRDALEYLPLAAEEMHAHLAVGAAISAKARYLGGNPAAQNDLACEVLCGMASNEAASIADSALQGLPAYGDSPAHALWRQRVLGAFQ